MNKISIIFLSIRFMRTRIKCNYFIFIHINFYISAEVVSNGSHADISVGLGGSEESEAALLQAITSEDAAKSTLQKYAETL